MIHDRGRVHGRVLIRGGNANAAGCCVNAQDPELLAKSLGEVFFFKKVVFLQNMS